MNWWKKEKNNFNRNEDEGVAPWFDWMKNDTLSGAKKSWDSFANNNQEEGDSGSDVEDW